MNAALAQRQEESPQLLRSDLNGVCTLTLNRPESRNALCDSLIAELHSTLNDVAADPVVRAVVITPPARFFAPGTTCAK